MAEQALTTAEPAAAPDGGALPAPGLPTQAGFFIERHYLRDLSLENPAGRIPAAEAPNLRLGLDGTVAVATIPTIATIAPSATAGAAVADTAGGDPAGGAAYQVDISLTLTAALGERVVFLTEATYRVEVTLHHIPAAHVAEVLCVEVPSAMFGQMQEVLQRNGAYAGYPEMQVAPLDFRAIFLRNGGASLTLPGVA